MKGFKPFLIFFLVVASFVNFSCNASSEGKGRVVVDGYVDGKWTMDLKAAREYAKKHNLPIMLNFTGSDWCVWCKLMEKQVFSKQKFYDFAKGKIVLVWIDFPRNKDLVPEKYAERNKKIANLYGVRGLPTYVILDSKGNEIARLGASRDITVDKFINQLKEVLSK